MCTYKKICITNRKLVKEPYFERIEKLAASKEIDMIILREKDLPETEYEKLAGEVLKICRKYDQLCMLHSFTDVARRLDHPYIHLPMQLFLHMTQEERLALPGMDRKRTRLNAPITATPAPRFPFTSIITTCTITGSRIRVIRKLRLLVFL